MQIMLPVQPWLAVLMVDRYGTNPGIEGSPLEELTVPTLLVHAVDDPVTSCDAAAAAAERISPGPAG